MSKSQTDLKTSSNNELIKRKRDLEKEIKEKEELLRQLKLVKSYKSKDDIKNLNESIEKWRQIAQSALDDLKSSYSSSNLTMIQLLNELNIDPKLVNYDPESDSFTN